MTDDFFQQIPQSKAPQGLTMQWSLISRILFYTSLLGFVLGSVFGYLHIKGWGPNAEEGLILYGIALCVSGILSICFGIYQGQQNQLKTKKIKANSKKG